MCLPSGQSLWNWEHTRVLPYICERRFPPPVFRHFNKKQDIMKIKPEKALFFSNPGHNLTVCGILYIEPLEQRKHGEEQINHEFHKWTNDTNDSCYSLIRVIRDCSLSSLYFRVQIL